MIDSLSIAVHVFPICMMISFSEDEILLPRYVKRSIYFRGLLFDVEVAPLCLKHMNFYFVLISLSLGLQFLLNALYHLASLSKNSLHISSGNNKSFYSRKSLQQKWRGRSSRGIVANVLDGGLKSRY